MLRVLIREEQICVTKVPVSSFYVIPLRPQQSNTVLIKLFLDLCFLRNFHVYQKLARTFAPAQVPDAKVMTVTWDNISKDGPIYESDVSMPNTG